MRQQTWQRRVVGIDLGQVATATGDEGRFNPHISMKRAPTKRVSAKRRVSSVEYACHFYWSVGRRVRDPPRAAMNVPLYRCSVSRRSSSGRRQCVVRTPCELSQGPSLWASIVAETAVAIVSFSGFPLRQRLSKGVSLGACRGASGRQSPLAG